MFKLFTRKPQQLEPDPLASKLDAIIKLNDEQNERIRQLELRMAAQLSRENDLQARVRQLERKRS